MSLRRFAQTNHASVAAGADPASPLAHKRGGASVSANGASPRMLPATPRRTQVVHQASPVHSPSLSAGAPFDWAAARAHAPAPYASPAGARTKRLSGVGTPGAAAPATPGRAVKRFVRKKTLRERIADFSARVAFEVSIFPANVPLPTPHATAALAAGALHTLHLCVRVSQGRRVPSAKQSWDDVDEVDVFDWTTVATVLLMLAAVANALYVLTRVRVYHLHAQPDVVASPNARFVPVTLQRAPPPLPPLAARVRASIWRALVGVGRFLLFAPKSRAGAQAEPVTPGRQPRRVQQLEAWAPGAGELALAAYYSPAHALLWMCTTGHNWMLTGAIMALVSVQIRVLTHAYEALLKDRAIIAAEVMHEYDEKFVNPRVNPVRKDAAVMTHESEMVNVWES